MRFTYPARLQRHSADEIVVSFRDLPECLTSAATESEALAEAADALEEAVAGRPQPGRRDSGPERPPRRGVSRGGATDHGGQGGIVARVARVRIDSHGIGPEARR